MEYGKVYLVGSGPGAKDLISLRGQQVLSQAQVVIYDYLVDTEILEHVNPQATLICCDKFGKSKRQVNPFSSQKKINSAILRFAKKGKLVVRLKNGDPFLFGRAQEEMKALLKNHIEFEVIPGITAASAASCFSGIPLTGRGIASSVVFVSGKQIKEKSIDWRVISQNETIVLYMAVSNIDLISGQLIKYGKPASTPVAAISRAGNINQKVIVSTLGRIAKAVKTSSISAPSIFIVGKIVSLRKNFDWLKKNKRVLFTGLSAKRFFLKGNYFHLPMIKIKPLDDYADFDSALAKICDFDWIIFTSRYTVEYFFKRLERIGSDARALSGIKIASIGLSTAGRLKDFSIISDLIPKVESSVGLISAFKKTGLKGKKVFLPHSDISDKGLSDSLRKLGAEVTSRIAYKNVPVTDLPELDLNNFDEIIFTSPSGVRNFSRRYGRPPENIRLTCIGEVTLAEAKKEQLI